MIARHLDSQTDGEFNYSCPLQVVEYGKAGLLFKPFLVPSKTCSCVRAPPVCAHVCARARCVFSGFMWVFVFLFCFGLFSICLFIRVTYMCR